jgi:hypothetical protein
MKRFILNLFRFSSLGLIVLIILGIIYITLDPFKVIKSYDSFYEQNAKAWVGINKDYVSTKTFINNSKRIQYNSFIFGNSRSIFYQVSEWKKYLPNNSVCYHFDASGESLFGMNKKIEFLNNKGVRIENVLLILDKEILLQDKPNTEHLTITAPDLVNNSNIINFHKTFFFTFLSPKFLYAYFDYKITGVVKPYMKRNNILDDRPRTYDLLSNEIRYDYFENLINKNSYYTNERMTVFYERDTVQKISKQSIFENQEKILANIQAIFRKHNTNAKIIIGPLYNQESLNKKDLAYLKHLFGKENIYDFSGINKFTNDYRNFYENSHYRPHVAAEIMKLLYNSSN